jgi:hypothetical protein
MGKVQKNRKGGGIGLWCHLWLTDLLLSLQYNFFTNSVSEPSMVKKSYCA